jgi:hypothetical protein
MKPQAWVLIRIVILVPTSFYSDLKIFTGFTTEALMAW